MHVRIKRIYEAPEASDGFRVLVDRLWPRGVSKEKAAFDLWLKGIAPSPELREWFAHDPAKFAEFKTRYEHELKSNPAVEELQKILHAHETATLLYAAHDPKVNHAKVLREYLKSGE